MSDNSQTGFAGELPKPSRLDSIDLLRGLVIAVMALDHVRDFFSISAGVFEPTDLTRTTAMLFLTRWITHFCAPIFVLLAGIGVYQAGVRGRSKPELFRFVLTRGLWLIALEILFITPLGWSFQLTWTLIRLQVIWVIGCSMVALSGLIWLPSRWVGWAGAAMIAGHNFLDGARGKGLGAGWKYLHSIQFLTPADGHTVASLYPLVPWVGVLMAGYGMGEIWSWPSGKRRQWLIRCGIACLALFGLFRLTNWYGDPNHWTPQPDVLFSVLSVLNVNKYPPSFLFLAMTLGPALLGLAWLEQGSRKWMMWLRDFGRVPLFFYLLHLPLIHGLAIVMSNLVHGDAAWLWRDPFALRRGAVAAPASYGFDLPGVYLVWIGCVAMLYPLCKWYAEYKQRKRSAILSYL